MRNGALVFVGSLYPALLLAQVPAGGEFRVSSSTTVVQYNSNSAVAANGDFVVVWQSGTGGSARILGRRFSSGGAALGGEFQVNTVTADNHNSPVVASAANGAFVVVWHVFANAGGRWAYAQRFDASGVPRGQNLVVQTGADWPDVASDEAGNFTVVSRVGTAISGQRFSAAGLPLGAPFQVNTSTTYELTRPSIASGPGGGFIVVWQGVQFMGPRFAVLGRRFDAAGAPLGAEFRINTGTTTLQGRAAVAVAASGDFVVTWDTVDDGSGSGILARRFNAAGSPLGGEFAVNIHTTGTQMYPYVAGDEAGNFVVAWSSFGQDGSIYGAFARRFSATGAARGAEFRVNTTTSLTQFGESVVSDRAGNFTVTWAASSPGGGDVMAQRFGGLLPAALAVDASGNGVLEPGESAGVRPSWRNANGAARTFGGTIIDFTGPPPATYQLLDRDGDYGTVPDGRTARCVDCYRAGVSATTRPAQHWDAVLQESITPDVLGEDKRWRVHIGDSFGDVPRTSAFYRFIETLLHEGVTAGCTAATYCPGTAATREQMAVFVLVAKEGSGYVPPVCGTPVFADVPATSPFCRWIEELARRGVTGGCGGGNYCPGDPVSREQMAVFVLRTLDPALNPPACTTPVFNDVPPSSPFCRWIEELARRGVVTGCGGGNYCPTAAVTREQMSVFLTGTFGLTLYGP